MTESHPNRYKSLKAKKSNGFWCPCDLCFVLPGQKCPVCRRKALKRKLKPNRKSD